MAYIILLLSKIEIFTFIYNKFIGAGNIKVCHIYYQSVVRVCVESPFALGITRIALQKGATSYKPI